MTRSQQLGWISIIRLGAVQAALGAVVVMMTSTINRVMVIELALPSIVPGLLIGLHYAVQILRPRWGHGSDAGGRMTPWIVGGMFALALGGFGAAVSIAVLPVSYWMGIPLAIISFTLVGAGAGCCGTTLLVMLAKHIAPEKRAPAASVVWIMMIAGFAVTAVVSGHYLSPYSVERLIEVMAVVCVLAVSVAVVATWGLEPQAVAQAPVVSSAQAPASPDFFTAVREVWAEPQARLFALFVFVSMLAYSAEEIILEPFAGLLYGLAPGETTKLSGLQHGGVLIGMIVTGAAGQWLAKGRPEVLRRWAVLGCFASGLVMLAIAYGALVNTLLPIRPAAVILGIANGAFAIAAISSMMAMAGRGKERREGVRLGIWGAAQGIAFGLGGIISSLAVDIAKAAGFSVSTSYAVSLTLIAGLFVAAAVIATRINRPIVSERPASAGWPAGGIRTSVSSTLTPGE